MKYAHNATTGGRVVHSLEELRMALDDKARGQQIAKLRKQRRLTQQQMSEKLGIAYRTYQTWESGTLPEWPNLEKLARFFKVKPEFLIGDAVPPPAPSQLDELRAAVDEMREKLDELLERVPVGMLAIVAQHQQDLIRLAEEAAAQRAAGQGSPGGKPRAAKTAAGPAARSPKKRRSA